MIRVDRRKQQVLSMAIAVCIGAPAAVAESPIEVEEILVTARRKEESIQTVPVSVTAFSEEKLVREGVQTTQDLMRMTPGVVLSGAGSNANTTFTIRGQGRDVIGPGQPSVISYTNEVPMPSWGAVLPAFDTSNIQVLKGPQGTLFGRNTTGGAVLVYTKKPTYELEGYVQGIAGDYSWRDIQGGISIPIIENTLAVRVAGQLSRRDGYTKVFNSQNEHFFDDDNIHTDAFRISVLFEPTDFIENTFVYDRLEQEEHMNGQVPTGVTVPDDPNQLDSLGNPNPSPPFRYISLGGFAGLDAIAQAVYGGLSLAPGFLPPVQIPFAPIALPFMPVSAELNCVPATPACNVDAKLQRQIAAGPRKAWSDVESLMVATYQGIANTTVIDIGDITVKNIFGWRNHDIFNPNNTDGIDAAVLNVDTYRNDDQFSNEIQVSGTLFNNKLDWLLGYFLLRTSPSGPQGLIFEFDRPAAIPKNAWLATVNQNAMFKDDSDAVFASGTVDLNDYVQGLKLSGGARYTKDRERACAASIPQASLIFDATAPGGRLVLGPTQLFQSFSECREFEGAFVGEVKSNEFTWQLGAEYAYSDNLFLYVTGRRGYRAGGVNTPDFANNNFAPYQTFDPHTVTDVEVGLKSQWQWNDMQGTFNVAYFYSDYHDRQEIISAIPPGLEGTPDDTSDDPSNTSLVANVGTATFQGIEAEASISPFDGLILSAAGAYIDVDKNLELPDIFVGLVTDDFPNTPSGSYMFAGSYRLPFGERFGEFYVSGDYYWVDEYVVGISSVPAYHLMNFNLEWRNAMNQPLSATLFVQNATDEDYQRNSTLSGFNPGFFTYGYGPPRMVGVRLRYEFGGTP